MTQAEAILWLLAIRDAAEELRLPNIGGTAWYIVERLELGVPAVLLKHDSGAISMREGWKMRRVSRLYEKPQLRGKEAILGVLTLLQESEEKKGAHP